MGMRRMGNCVQNPRGLTLIGLMVVVVFIGILFSIAIPNYIGSMKKAKIVATVAEIKLVEEMIQIYNIDYEK